MASQDSNHIPLPPPSAPPQFQLSRDSNGNLFYRGPDGLWYPYNVPPPVRSNLCIMIFMLIAVDKMPQMQDPRTPAGPGPGSAMGPPNQLIPQNQPDRRRDGPDEPVQQAFSNQYHFSLHPATPVQRPIPIDPALVPLPDSTDADLRHPPTVFSAMGLSKTEKVAGKRVKAHNRRDRSRSEDSHRAKGKTVKRPLHVSGSEDENEPVAKRGRPSGSANYSKKEIKQLFAIIEVQVPLGQKGWKAVHESYSAWAQLNGYPKRAEKALEGKYKSFLKVKKPTGSADCPPEVVRAHELENLINTEAGTVNLSDNDIDSGASSDHDIEFVEQRPAPRSSDNTQFFAISQQLRDSQALSERLRNEIRELERDRDRAEFDLKLMQFTHPSHGRGRSHRRTRRVTSSHKRAPGIERVDGKIRVETRFPEGGAQTVYYTDPSTGEEVSDHSDEGFNSYFPSRSRSRSHHRDSHTLPTLTSGPSYRPVSRRRSPTPGPSRHSVSHHHNTTAGPSYNRCTPSPLPGPIETAHTPAPQAQAPGPLVTGTAVQLVLTPARGPVVGFTLSPNV
ncbi:hypothetical protein B0H14DRAFT_3153066 [Mycena olivaceomarginata]|nr:hypothetical protein B0H14DRAFT_3153066 [Mycena olivaceomarginata]